MQAYSDPRRTSDPHALPDIEVFHATGGELGRDDDGNPLPAGWYWWMCFPGCLPDSYPIGPFDTEEEALADARDDYDDDYDDDADDDLDDDPEPEP